jgi:hypothetical protein
VGELVAVTAQRERDRRDGGHGAPV